MALDLCRFCGEALRAERCAVCDEADAADREEVARRRAERLLVALAASGRLELSGRFAARGLAPCVARALRSATTLDAQARALAECLVRQPAVLELYASDAELAAAIARTALAAPPPARGAFAHGALRFALGAPAPRVRAVGEPFARAAFERELLARVAPLAARVGDAPVASWVLARVAALASEPPPLPRELVTTGGGWSFRVHVARAGVPAAVLELVGDTAGVAVRGDARDARTAEAVLDALAAALAADPGALAECEVRVRDPRWHQEPCAYAPRPTLATRARYGLAQGALLGADNPRLIARR